MLEMYYFWTGAGLGLLLVGWGVMRWLVAKAESVEAETERKRGML